MIRLFASDFDGTLFQKSNIAIETLREIEAFRACGNLFGVCTGRDPLSLKAELTRAALDCDFLIMMNGAQIEYRGECIRKRQLPHYEICLPLLRKTCRFFSMIGNGELYLHADAAFFTDNPGEQRFIEALQKHYRRVKSPEALGAVCQISCCTADSQQAVALAGELEKLGMSAVPNLEYVDISPAGVSKAEALAFLCQQLSIPSEAVYTAGDGRNDIPMLSRFGGFAMANAEPLVQQSAQMTAASVGQALQILSKEHS